MTIQKPSKKLPLLISGIALASLTCQLQAAGFQLKEQSAEGQGNSFAGQTAKAVDASTIFFNPAGMTLLSGNQVQGNISYIAPSADYSHSSNSAGAFPFTKTNGVDGGVSAFVPAAYAMWDYSDDVKLGISMNVPFGLSTEYDKNWVGAEYNVLSEIETINIAPSIAYRVNDKFSIGGNVQFQKIKGQLTRQNTQAGNATSRLKADDTAFGFGVGLLYEYSDKGRIGFNYRSEINHTLKGDLSTPVASPLVNFDAKADITMPAVASIGLYHEVSDQWTVLADIAWTDWSVFDELQIVNTETNTNVPNPTQYNWSDTVFAAVGANYQYSEKLQLKFGLAYDQGAANTEDRTAGIPDATRHWISVGAAYDIDAKSTVNVGYSHVKARDVDVSEDTKTTSYSGTFKPHVNIINVGYTYKF